MPLPPVISLTSPRASELANTPARFKIFATTLAYCALSSLSACATAPVTTTPASIAAAKPVITREPVAGGPLSANAPAPVDVMPAVVTDLIIRDSAIGKGDAATPGAIMSVHYTGWLYDPKMPRGKGKKFDSSLDRNERFNITLGVSRVIQGWTRGLAGMKVGTKRTLIIPPSLGYGERGAGGVIPPHATLLFEIELFTMTPGPAPVLAPVVAPPPAATKPVPEASSSGK